MAGLLLSLVDELTGAEDHNKGDVQSQGKVETVFFDDSFGEAEEGEAVIFYSQFLGGCDEEGVPGLCQKSAKQKTCDYKQTNLKTTIDKPNKNIFRETYIRVDLCDGSGSSRAGLFEF